MKRIVVAVCSTVGTALLLGLNPAAVRAQVCFAGSEVSNITDTKDWLSEITATAGGGISCISNDTFGWTVNANKGGSFSYSGTLRATVTNNGRTADNTTVSATLAVYGYNDYYDGSADSSISFLSGLIEDAAGVDRYDDEEAFGQSTTKYGPGYTMTYVSPGEYRWFDGVASGSASSPE